MNRRIEWVVLIIGLMVFSGSIGAILQERYGLPHGSLCEDWDHHAYSIVDSRGKTYTLFAKHPCQVVYIGLKEDGEWEFVNVTHR